MLVGLVAAVVSFGDGPLSGREISSRLGMMTPTEPTPVDPARMRLVPRVKIWFEVGPDYGFGAGLVQILQAVDRAGSIKRAAAELGRSYRHVWDRIKEAEQALGCPLVETQVGGQGAHRSDLTPAARRLIDEFLAIRRRMIEVLEAEFAGRGAGPPE